MESRVSNREAKFNEFKKSQDEFRISQAEFQVEVLLQFRLLAEKLGVESSAATPTHQLFIKSTSPLSLEKSNEIVLKLQSFHKEKVRAREKIEEFWSQFRPRYKPKSPPCLQPILKKFKRVRCSHQCSEFPSYQPLKREDLDHGNKSRPCSVSKKLEAHDMIQGFLKDETLEFGCKKIWVTEIGEEIYPFRSKPATILESDCKNGKSQVFILEIHVSNVGFKKTELPGSRALYMFDKMSKSGYISDIKLGYHMSIRDKGGTNFLSSFESIDLLASCIDSGFCVVINRSMGYYCEGIRDKGGTTIQGLLNSKSTGKVETILVQDDASTSVVLILQLCYHKGIRDKGGGLSKDKIWRVQMNYNSNSKFSIISEYKVVLRYKITQTSPSFVNVTKYITENGQNVVDWAICLILLSICENGILGNKDKDCVLGSDSSKAVSCEVGFDPSMIIDGEYAGNLEFHHLDTCMDKNRKNESKFTLSRFKTGKLELHHQPPSVIPSYETGTTKVAFVDQSLQERNRILSLLKSNLVAAQYRMKAQFDKRTGRMLDMGDLVYLRLVPYQHVSLASHSFHKLQPHFYGPFEVLAKVGPMAYKLKLPGNSKLHPVFHVSCCLMKHLESQVQPTIPLLVITDSGILQGVPIAILDRRKVIQWQNHSKEDDTWELYQELKFKFQKLSIFRRLLFCILLFCCCCVVLDRDMCYCKGIRDKGGGSKFSYDMNIIVAEMEKFMKVTTCEFMVDSLVLPLGECDVTISGQWLCTFEPVFMGFQEYSHGFAGWRDRVEHLLADMHFKKLISQRSFGFVPSSTCKGWIFSSLEGTQLDMIKKGNAAATKVLVMATNLLPKMMLRGELYHELKLRFPGIVNL